MVLQMISFVLVAQIFTLPQTSTNNAAHTEKATWHEHNNAPTTNNNSKYYG